MNSSSPLYHLRPKLDEILDDSAPFPYTLSAFIAFLSKNHCLEILEFVLETRRYCQGYQVLDKAHRRVLNQQWQRLLQIHILPGAPREINIPDKVRDGLLASSQRPGSTDDDDGDDEDPPDPALLDPAVQQMHELMNDSILLPFLRDCSSPENVRPLSTSCLNANGTLTPKGSSDDTRSEHQRRNVFPYSPPPSSHESQSQSQSPPQSAIFDGSHRSSIVFSDDKPLVMSGLGSINRGGSISSGARSMHTISDNQKESSDLTRTKSTPTRKAEANGHRKKKWHRLPKGAIFRHLRRSSG